MISVRHFFLLIVALNAIIVVVYLSYLNTNKPPAAPQDNHDFLFRKYGKKKNNTTPAFPKLIKKKAIIKQKHKRRTNGTKKISPKQIQNNLQMNPSSSQKLPNKPGVQSTYQQYQGKNLNITNNKIPTPQNIINATNNATMINKKKAKQRCQRNGTNGTSGKCKRNQTIVLNFNESIFKQLGLYDETLQRKYYNDDPVTLPNFVVPNMGLINDPEYCEQVDAYNLENPDNILKHKNFVTDYNADGLARKLVMKKMGHDVLPDEVSKDMNKTNWTQRLYQLPKNLTMIFTKKVRFHYYHEYGKNLFCQTQMYNHIPGHGILVRKDLNVDSVNKFSKKMVNKSECFNASTFFPMTYRLDNETECQDFFAYIKTEAFQKIKEREPVPFISKVSWGSGRGNGIEIMNDDYEKRLRRKYENGTLCGEIIDNVILQQYISNPLTVKGHKFDFRIYMLIASTNPLIVYYHDGFLRISLHKYEKNSTELSAHATNTALAKRQVEKADGVNKTESLTNQMWGMEKLKDYLIEQGKVTDPNWLDNYLRPYFKKAFIQLVMMTQDKFLKKSNVFELFGLDFLLDENLNLWFLECNASPVFQGTSKEKEIFQSTLLKDMFKIEYALLRSRFSRIRKFIKELQEKKDEKHDLNKLRQKFNKINKNKFEPSFPINENNTFTKIIDMSLKGKDVYANLFDENCFK